MLVNEIITETAVGTLHLGPIEVRVDDHALDRAKTRGVYPRGVDYTLRRLSKIANKLEKVEVGQQFWVYDWTSEISLGLRRISSDRLVFLLKTVYPARASRTPNIQKIIDI
jgi:hypothetical protein